MDHSLNVSEKGEEKYMPGVMHDKDFYPGATNPEFHESDFMRSFRATLPQDTRIEHAFAVGSRVYDSAKQYNPLKDISSIQQLTSKIRKEAVACFDPREYSKPNSRDEVTARLRSNIRFFRLTYGATCLFFFIYFLLTSPFLLIQLALVAAVWVFFFKIKLDETIQIGSYVLGNREKLLIAVGLTLFVILFGGLISYLFYVAMVSSFFICIHAAFRNQIESNPLDDLAESQQQFV